MKLIRTKFLKMSKKLIYILFLIGFVGFSQENPVSISSNTSKIQIGEQVQYKITVSSKGKVDFPLLILDSLKKVEIIESFPIDTLKDVYEKRFLLTSFDSGQYVIPMQIIYIDKKIHFSKSFLLDVSTVKVDTLKQKMYEIKSIKSEPKTIDEYFKLAMWIILALILMALILYFILRKKKEKEQILHLAPIQIAFKRLKELDEKQLLQQDKVKAYYSELTDIIRTYIENDINIPALESTTNELIETIIDFNDSSKLGISKETISQLKGVLQSADLVKFAKSKPFVEEIKNDRNIVEVILKNTQTAVHRNDVEDEKVDLTTMEKVSEPIEAKKEKKKVVKYFLIGIAIILIGIIGYVGFQFGKKALYGNSITRLMEKHWISESYGNPSISIDTPELLKTEPVKVSADGGSIIGDFSTFTFGTLKSDLFVSVSTTKFISNVQGIGEYDLDNYVKGYLRQMESSMATIFSNSKFDEITINGFSGKKVVVDYKRKGLFSSQETEYNLTMLFFADEKGMRQVVVTNLKLDEGAQKIKNRIINSIVLKS